MVAVIGIILRFTLPVGKPLVSVRAEELFHIGGYTVTNSLLLTWIVMLLLVVLAVVATAKLRRGDEQALRQPRGLQNTMEMAVEAFYNTMSGVSPKYAARFFVIVATIFFLVLPANWAGLVPGVGSFGTCFAESELHHSEAAPAAEGASAEAVETEQKNWGAFTNQCAQSADAKIRDEAKAKGLVFDTPLTAEQEPEYLRLATELDESGQIAPLFHPYLRAGSADLNLTLALALISFLTTEFWGFRKQGLGYLSKFFINPFKHGLIQTFVGIIELISEFARIISFTFRLFGNIFAGEVVLLVMAFLFPTLLSLPFYGLELFVGAVQAFVFAMLTMAFIDMAGEAHGDHGHEEHAH